MEIKTGLSYLYLSSGSLQSQADIDDVIHSLLLQKEYLILYLLEEV